MAFRFPLDPLLRLRRSQQRQQELVLQKKNNEVHRLQLSLAGIEAEMSLIAAQTLHGRNGAEIGFDQQRLGILRVRKVAAEELLLRAIVERDQAGSEFRRSWQKCETIETLRRHAQYAFRVGQSRREQRTLDDWFIERKRTR